LDQPGGDDWEGGTAVKVKAKVAMRINAIRFPTALFLLSILKHSFLPIDYSLIIPFS
jgi:hypothetical protein